MKNVSESIKKCLLKRQVAIDRFKTRKEAFLLTKEQIIKDIEEARSTWANTLEQLPRQEFDQ